MYICDDCGRLFETPMKCYGEPLEYFGFPTRETWDGCPNCEGAYDEAIYCVTCGELIRNSQDKTFCDYCGTLLEE